MSEAERTFNTGEPLFLLDSIPVGETRIVNIHRHQQKQSLMVIRLADGCQGYLNRCRHLPIPLDWGDGEVLDESGDYFLCRTHGALFSVIDGMCVQGPCRGRSLVSVPLIIEDGWIKVRKEESHDEPVTQ
jgi:nitrite reductase/ring-hydroxylating ferredoxin subunit